MCGISRQQSPRSRKHTGSHTRQSSISTPVRCSLPLPGKFRQRPCRRRLCWTAPAGSPPESWVRLRPSPSCRRSLIGSSASPHDQRPCLERTTAHCRSARAGGGTGLIPLTLRSAAGSGIPRLHWWVHGGSVLPPASASAVAGGRALRSRIHPRFCCREPACGGDRGMARPLRRPHHPCLGCRAHRDGARVHRSIPNCTAGGKAALDTRGGTRGCTAARGDIRDRLDPVHRTNPVGGARAQRRHRIRTPRSAPRCCVLSGVGYPLPARRRRVRLGGRGPRCAAPRHTRAINTVGGALLVATGILMVTGVWSLFMSHLQAVISGAVLPL